MTDLPLVSIITPSFNQAEYLEQTLLSVLNQDYPRIEYLVVDGRSSDGSIDIIRQYAHRLSGWVSEPDQGQAEAINKGLMRASGEVVAWLNSDDVYLPGALRAAVETLQTHPEAGLVYGDVLAIDAAGVTTNRLACGDYGLAELMQFNIINQPAVFMRRSVLMQAGPLNPQFHFLLDHQLWLRLAQLAPVFHVAQPWAAGRFHAAAKNVARAAEFGREAYALVDWMQTQPALADEFRRSRRRIWAGAHRINARYLLDGGDARGALRAYGRCLAASPGIALPGLHRMAYAAASLLVNVEGLKRWYLSRRQQNLKESARLPRKTR